MQNKEKLAYKVSIINIILNVFLTAFKLFAGIIAHSSAMVSDAVESASDIFGTIIVIVGIKISSKKADEKHQYGHERFECAAAIILSMILAVTGVLIGYNAIIIIKNGLQNDNFVVPGTLALIAAIITIIIKETMFHYTNYAAKKINSNVLKADAWHHRSDGLSSIGTFIGIFGARHGLPILDPFASILICILIIKTAITIFIDSINKMTDNACDKELEEKIRTVIQNEKGVLNIDRLKTRQFGNRVYVDAEIMVDGTILLTEAHCIAENVHKSIEKSFETVKHCMVHVNPDKK